MNWNVFYGAFKKVTGRETLANNYEFKDDECQRLVVLAEDIFGIQLSIMETLNVRSLSDLERQIQTTLNAQTLEPNP